MSDTQNANDAKHNDNNTAMSFDEWLNLGVNEGFCTPMYCDNHDAYHADDWAIISDMPDNDFCWPVVRLKISEFEQQGYVVDAVTADSAFGGQRKKS